MSDVKDLVIQPKTSEYVEGDLLSPEDVEKIKEFEKRTNRSHLTRLYYSNPNADFKDIANQLTNDTGVEYSVDAVKTILLEERKRALATVQTDLEELLADELLRLDALEQIAWDAFLRSQNPVKRRIVDEVMREVGEDDYEAIISNVRTISDYTPGDYKYLSLIDSIQKERRKVLGSYRPEIKHLQADLTIKPYVTVSPDDWD